MVQRPELFYIDIRLLSAKLRGVSGTITGDTAAGIALVAPKTELTAGCVGAGCAGTTAATFPPKRLVARLVAGGTVPVVDSVG